GSSLGGASEQPGSSSSGRTLDEPELYTYTFSSSSGSTRTACVCEPRHVWTWPTFTALRLSLMSKIRRPLRRSVPTPSDTPCAPQSGLPESPSPETKTRFRYTETSLCEAGQT